MTVTHFGGVDDTKKIYDKNKKNLESLMMVLALNNSNLQGAVYQHISYQNFYKAL